MEQLFNKVAAKEVEEDSFDVEEELEKPTFSKAGDLWHLGRHIVFCGDSTDPASYEKLMDGVKANVIATDPPYNVNVEETAGRILNDNMPDEDFYKFLLTAYSCMHDNLADDAPSMCSMRTRRGAELPQSLCRCGLLSVRVLHLEKKRPGIGALSLPVAARAVLVWLEEGR